MKNGKLKPVTVNFLLVLIVILGFFVMAGVFSGLISSIENELDVSKGGWGNLFGQMGIFFFAVMKWFFIIYGCILLFFSGIATITYGPSKGRILAYRILMGITYFFIISPMFTLMNVYFNNDLYVFRAESIVSIIILTLVEIVLFVILFFNIRNTYTKRIYPASMSEQLSESTSVSKQESYDDVNKTDPSR